MGNHLTIWHILVIAFALTAATGDVRFRKIPRAFTTAGLAAGLLFHVIYGGFASAAAATIVAFAIGVALFQLGAIGGGDVKLIVALGAMLGFKPWLFAMEMAVFTAGAMALVQVVHRGKVRQTLTNVGQTLRWVASRGAKAHPVINVNNPAMLRAPFGVAAAVGTVLAVVAL